MSGLQTVIKEYFDQIGRKNLVIAFLVERVRMLTEVRRENLLEIKRLKEELNLWKEHGTTGEFIDYD